MYFIRYDLLSIIPWLLTLLVYYYGFEVGLPLQNTNSCMFENWYHHPLMYCHNIDILVFLLILLPILIFSFLLLNDSMFSVKPHEVYVSLPCKYIGILWPVIYLCISGYLLSTYFESIYCALVQYLVTSFPICMDHQK